MSMLADRHSQLCGKSELELFTAPDTQVAIQEGFWTEYHPLATLTDTSPIEFLVSGGSDSLIDLSQSYLHIRCKIVKGAATILTATDKVGPVNQLLHSLFSQCDVSLNGKLISASDNSYAYRSYLETLLTYGEDAKTGQFTGVLWDTDTASQFDVGDPGGANEGLKNRSERTKLSGTLDLYGRPHLDLFHQERLLLNNVDLRLKFIRAKDAFCLMSDAANATYRINLTHASLFVRKALPSPSILLAHNQALSKGNAKYPLQRVEVKTFTIAAGSLQGNLDNVVLGSLPSMCVVGLVSNSAYNGDFTKNPFNFQHFGVNYLSLLVDGKQVPSVPFQPNYTTDCYVRNYMSLFQATGKISQNEGPQIKYTDYKGGSALYAFDLTPDLGSDQCHFNLTKQGNIRIDIRFAAALGETLNLVLYTAHQTVLEIDKSRNVLYDY
jgi:hypothetical protein